MHDEKNNQADTQQVHDQLLNTLRLALISNVQSRVAGEAGNEY